MTVISSKYANILNENKILYMPSCIVVEMMTKLYSQVSMINLSNSVHNVMPDLLILLRRLTQDLKTTATAYWEERIRFFIGDWKTDKRRARKLLFYLMSRLGYMCPLLGKVDRQLLYKAVEEMSAQWAVLDTIMEEKCNFRHCLYGCKPCRSTSADSVDTWPFAMAKTVLELHEKSTYPDDKTHLILLCYDRIRTGLLNAINTEFVSSSRRKLHPARVLSVSNDDHTVDCPKCGRMNDVLRRGSTEVIRKDYANTQPETPSRNRRRIKIDASLRGRRPMPPSLAGIAR